MNDYSDGRLSRSRRAEREEEERIPPERIEADSHAEQTVRPAAGRRAQVPAGRERTASPDFTATSPGTAFHREPAEEESGEEQAQQLATNRTVMLCCTLAAMCGPFAAFLLYAERGSRAIRHNSVQSLALTVMHLLGAGICLGLDALLGGVPVLGMCVELVCWLAYAAVLVSVIAMWLKLMNRAWHGLRYDLPLLGWWLERFV